MGIRERGEYIPVPGLQGDEAELLASTFNSVQLATLKQAREMLVAAWPVDQISEESVDSLLSEAWQGQEAPLVLAARVLRRICAMDER